jgi:hypothetical protein
VKIVRPMHDEEGRSVIGDMIYAEDGPVNELVEK